MTVQDWDDDDFDGEGGNQQKPNPVRDRMRKLEKENKELREAHDKAMAQLRQSTVSTVLKTKGVSPKVARLVPKDIEPTDEAIGKWLDEYADIFGPPAPAEGEGEKPAEGSEPDPAELEQAAKMGRIAEATAATQIPTADKELAARLASKDLKKEELLEMIHKAGGGFGSG